MADVKLTKYIDGSGIQALYKKIRTKVTGSDAAVTGNWYAGAIKIETPQQPAQGSKYSLVFWDSTSYNSWGTTDANVVKTPKSYPGFYITNGGTEDSNDHTLFAPKLNITTATGLSITGGDNTKVLLGNGSPTAINELAVKSADQVKSTTATGEYYILGSTNSDESTDTPVKLSSVKVDASGNLTANGFNGPLKITAKIAGGSAGDGTRYPLLTKNGSINANDDDNPYITPEAFGSVYITKLEEKEVVVAPKFVGDLKGNATNATNAENADKADTLKVSAPTNTGLGVGTNFYFWGDTSSEEGYSSVLKRSSTYLSTGTTHGDQLHVGGVTVSARINPSECGENELTPKAYVDWAINAAVMSGVSSVMTIKGRYGTTSSTNDLPTKADELKKVRTGWTYIVSADGLTFAQQNYSGANAQQVDKGDMIVCVGEDTENGANVVWTIIQRNIPEALTTIEVGQLLDAVDNPTQAEG